MNLVSYKLCKFVIEQILFQPNKLPPNEIT
jgi:hypothetical protein